MRRMGRLLSRLSLRARLTLIAALAVAIAVAGVASAAYIAVSRQLRTQEDASLGAQLQAVTQSPFGVTRLFDTGFESGPQPFVQQYTGAVVDGSGQTVAERGSRPVTAPGDFTDVASGRLQQRTADARLLTGEHVRVLAFHAATRDGDPVAVLIERNVSDDDATLAHLRLLLIVAGGLGVLLAAGGGLLVARSGLRPVDRLTAAAEHIAATEELDIPIEVTGTDELARLARAFNSMTSALSSSRDRQQQLVADAGHELRTPLTSMRTNIDLLLRSERSGRVLPKDDRARLLDDLAAQMSELGTLVGELVNLARDDRAIEPIVDTDFAEVVGRAVSRVRLRSEGSWEVLLQPWLVAGRPSELERAVVNLLDNAVKFSPPGAPVEVTLSGGVLTIADRGPGVTEEDRPHVFDRFYRSTSARGMPGSGLGLAIVSQTVTSHGGTVALGARDGGGTVASVELPGSPGEVEAGTAEPAGAPASRPVQEVIGEPWLRPPAREFIGRG